VTLREQVVEALHKSHVALPCDPGLDVGALRHLVAPDLPQPLWSKLIDELASKRLIARCGAWVQLWDHASHLTDEDRELVGRLDPFIHSVHLDPPWVRDIASSTGVSEEQVRQLMCKLATRGVMYQVVQDLFYTAEAIQQLAQIVSAISQKKGSVRAAHFRDITRLPRKRIVRILEFFDRVGYTRRIEDTHMLVMDSGWREVGPDAWLMSRD
jgi:selenocysteine-specific elongation factor